jgi:hypothetical protein
LEMAMRKSETSAALIVVAMLSAMVGRGPLLAQKARTIPYDPSTSIESRLLPEDVAVHVEQKPLGLITILPEPRDLEGWTDYSVGFSDAAVILRIDRVRGKWSEPMSSWISTEVTVTPTEVLYSNVDHMSVGHAFTFLDESGGQVRVGQCPVTAGLPINVHEGGSYLFFFTKLRDEGGRLQVTRTVFAVERGRLVDTRRDLKRAGHYLPPDGRSLSDVRKAIKRAAAAEKREGR